ncbi:hypothetical protein B0A52_00732 [Exophiala mesophila]|uniref:Chromatin remodeling factor mit1 n=1 Tax=Exophiala mesophila TaxID=212818 RepID=A0A438NI14_EXOME|nr:hypothetical protein B0A52_00732 [Exophiala mesophila]
MDEIDLSEWTKNPPPSPPSPIAASPTADKVGRASSKPLGRSSPASSSNSSADLGDIYHDENPRPSVPTTRSKSPQNMISDSSDLEEVPAPRRVTTTKQTMQSFYIDLPRLSAKDKAYYDFLPGHFTAHKFLSQHSPDRYIIKLASGEKTIVNNAPSLKYPPDYADSRHQQVSSHGLRSLENGDRILEEIQTNPRSLSSKRQTQPLQPSQMVAWTTIEFSDSEDDAPSKAHDVGDDSEVYVSDPSSVLDEHDGSEDDTQTHGRRSARLSGKPQPNAYIQDLDDLLDDSDSRPRCSTRARNAILPSATSRRSSRQQPRRPRRPALSSSPEPEIGTRRSERSRAKPRQSMRERDEDDISSHEEEKIGTKAVAAKEHFAKIPESDPFRRRHRQDCDTCYYKGDDTIKGPLVFCQGCTNSYHKACLGPRGSRDHLVTKVGQALFVLQCRRCIGLSHERDRAVPHQGICVKCNHYGELSKPLRNRLTTKQEQAQREENGGQDPITIVDANTINNPANVLFRCSQCVRVWHMHHLPERKTAQTVVDDDEDDENEAFDDFHLGQKRFDYYHRSWKCKDCIENQHQIDTLVAWRPVNIDAYVPGTTVDRMQENEKEYLVKWRAQSYFRTTWMPGLWVWGIVAAGTRASFAKKPENQLPKMTTADAIPEDFFRVDAVLDVRYSSVVRNSTKEIDLARAKEVDMAFVKFRALGYEDAIWEKPPSYADSDRWNDFQTAYEDYVRKLHLSVPPRTTLQRHLAHIRTLDFSALDRKQQPPNLTGGEMMAYQLEGLNWLTYQWFKSQNAILADEMGLGKTIQLVAFFAALVQDHKCWPFLVVVPNSTCPNWRREIQKWAPTLRAVAYYGTSAERRIVHDYELFPKNKNKEDEKHHELKKRSQEVKDIKAHIVITSYESIIEEKTRNSLMKVPWQGLVVDEGQRLKSDRTQIYDILSKFRFPFKVLLTGTPLQNNARELFNLLQFLDKSLSAAELEVKYANLTPESVGELHETLRRFFLRRTKAQVLTFLPPMAQIIVPVTMSTVQKKVYKSILAKNPQLMKSIFSRDPSLGVKDRHNLNNILMHLRKVLCHPFVYSREIEERTVEADVSDRNLIEASSKLQLLSLMLPKLQERGHRVLMFSQFLDNLDVMEDFLDGLGFQHRRVDGTVTSMEKQKRIDEFNAPDSPFFAFLLSTRAGGVGINLATADTVIILDPDFNPHQDIQALSRAHRIGQKEKVLVFQLMTRDSVEEKIMQIGRKKMALDHVLIERMDREDDAGSDLETILRHGAQELFEDDPNVADIVYDSGSVDRLLDRSQIEDTKISDDKSAESQFSFARIWANEKGSLEEDLEVKSGTNTPRPGIWDKILSEREKTFQEEEARKAQAYGRGKRKRENVDYGVDDGDNVEAKRRGKGGRVDGEYNDDNEAESPDDEIISGEDTDVMERKRPRHVRLNAHVKMLLQTLKESTESKDLIDQATKYLRMIKGDLIQRRRAQERKELEAKARRMETEKPMNQRSELQIAAT